MTSHLWKPRQEREKIREKSEEKEAFGSWRKRERGRREIVLMFWW